MVTSKEEIELVLSQNLEAISKFGVSRIGLFGSFVRNEQSDESDVDLLVEFLPNEKSVDHFLDLADFLEKLFERRVDLVTDSGLSPHLGSNILSEAKFYATSF